MRRLLNLSLEDKRRFLESFDYVLTDCDGVLWTLNEPLEGADRAIRALKDAGKRIVFVSNNGAKSLERYQEQIAGLGHSASEDDIVCPAISVVRHLQSINFQGLIFAICSKTFMDILRKAGYEVISGPSDPLPESVDIIVSTIDDKLPVKAVIFDNDFNFNHMKLFRAELYLKNDPNCLLIAGAISPRIFVTPLVDVTGMSQYFSVLEQSTNRKAVILGKPSPRLAEQLKNHLQITQNHRVLFVGDMIAQDVIFGRFAGFQTLLVLSGGTSREMVETLENDENVPDFYTDSFADLDRLIQDVTRDGKGTTE
ncbi:uncharacterized protein LOC120422653 [Culex pipiens pallens]|uniref:uncharacterized protein LOC120422653 n=1 Tax=Culex pipiens pallens TaxID=42434 RepID=UPI001954541B|nr:uncharacterized protein LOC120422653 [Culex pipiens pallens]